MFDDLEEVQDEEDCENQKDCADGKDYVDFKIAEIKDKHETENIEENEKPSGIQAQIRISGIQAQPNTSANLTTITNVDLDEVDAEYDLNGKSLIYWLFNSIYYLLLSQSELVCYFLMILTHLLSASILSLPLPFAVFLWALLSLPRPNKIFWITCITYIEVCSLLLPDYSNKTFVRIF